MFNRKDTALMFWIFTTASYLFGSTAYFGVQYGVVIGFACALISFGLTFKLFTLTVPPATGVVTMNYFKKDAEGKGELRIYKRGLNLRYMWELIVRSFKLEVVLNDFEEESKDGTTQKGFTFPMKDGPEITVPGSYQYHADENNLERLIMIDEKTIRDGIRDMVSGFMAHWLRNKKTETVLKQTRMLSVEIDNYFSREVARNSLEIEGSKKIEALETEYGIVIDRIVPSKITFGIRYQNARATERIMHKLSQTARDTMSVKIGDDTHTIPFPDALDNVLIIDQPDVTKHVQKVQGNAGEALAALFMSAFGQGNSGERR